MPKQKVNLTQNLTDGEIESEIEYNYVPFKKISYPIITLHNVYDNDYKKIMTYKIASLSLAKNNIMYLTLDDEIFCYIPYRIISSGNPEEIVKAVSEATSIDIRWIPKKTKKYEVWHEITLSLWLGEFEAESMDKAEQLAEKELEKHSIEDYQENRELVTSEAEE